MSPEEATKTILTTDYGIDKILYTFSGSFNSTSRYGSFRPRLSTYTINHDAGVWGLIVGAYSTDNNTWFPFGVNQAITSGPHPDFQTIEVNASCSDSSIIVYASNWTTTPSTIYFALQLIARD